MDTITLLLFLFGLVLLIVGAELLVRGASRLAAAVGVSPLVIGLTVVAYGTSSPELAVSVQSTFTGQANIALGNVVGSNIFNVLLILGVSALVAPLLVAQQLVWLDVPIMIGASVVAFLVAQDGVISRFDGALLFAGAIAYTTFLIRQSRKESKEIKDEYAQEFGANGSQSPGSIVLQLGFIIAGLALLVLGSRWLVNGAVEAARWFGVSELVIGLTIIAAGTSLPEVATSVLASIRGERDIAVGNVVGSNIFNLLAVLGLASLLAPGGVNVAPAVLSFDLPVMIVVAVACLPIFFTGHVIARWEGALFFGYYLAYTFYLILAAAEHDALPQFSLLMLNFVIPLTVLTLALVTVRSLRASRSRISAGKR
ncbi:MAG: calcium/sodium antiporter [Candidatus Binatia bacterium]